MASAVKRDLIRALQNLNLAGRPLPKFCDSCGADLVYVKAVFREFAGTNKFVLPLGFCPDCDGLPAVQRGEVA
jgi:hypothetical protein